MGLCHFCQASIASRSSSPSAITSGLPALASGEHGISVLASYSYSWARLPFGRSSFIDAVCVRCLDAMQQIRQGLS